MAAPCGARQRRVRIQARSHLPRARDALYRVAGQSQPAHAGREGPHREAGQGARLEKIAVAVQKHMRQNGGGQQYRGPADTMQAMLQIEYPDVAGHEDALGWSQGWPPDGSPRGAPSGHRAGARSDAEGPPAVPHAKQPTHRPPPTASLKAKYAGVGRSGAGRDPDEEREEVVTTKPPSVRWPISTATSKTRRSAIRCGHRVLVRGSWQPSAPSTVCKSKSDQNADLR